MNELPWTKLAKSYIGLKEIKGERHNPTIIHMLDKLGHYQKESKAWWREDETPWCGVFVGFILGETQRYIVKEWYRAKEWASPKLSKLKAPAYGAIAVLDRVGGGHVGFVVGQDSKGNIMLLGGNQSDMVRIDAFKPERITGYYWPSRWNGQEAVYSIPYAERYDLPVLVGDGAGNVTLS